MEHTLGVEDREEVGHSDWDTVPDTVCVTHLDTLLDWEADPVTDRLGVPELLTHTVEEVVEDTDTDTDPVLDTEVHTPTSNPTNKSQRRAKGRI